MKDENDKSNNGLNDDWSTIKGTGVFDELLDSFSPEERTVFENYASEVSYLMSIMKENILKTAETPGALDKLMSDLGIDIPLEKSRDKDV